MVRMYFTSNTSKGTADAAFFYINETRAWINRGISIAFAEKQKRSWTNASARGECSAHPAEPALSPSGLENERRLAIGTLGYKCIPSSAIVLLVQAGNLQKWSCGIATWERIATN